MRIKQFIKNNVSIFARISFCLLVFCAAVKLCAVLSPAFADFFNRHISSLLRAVLAYATSIIPFSLAETLIISAIPFAIIYIIYLAKKLTEDENGTRRIINLLAISSMLISLFTVNLSIAYDCTPLEKKLQLDTAEITEEELYLACEYAIKQLESLEWEITREPNGASLMPYSFSELGDKLNQSYNRLYGEYSFLSPLYVNPKPIALSEALTYTHIAGMYTFFTGESNVNINYPHYVVAFSAAHEMAHQRGVAPEDEANFTAFLACITSNDKYLNYCGYAQILEYLGNALHASDSEKFQTLLLSYPQGLLEEYLSYSNMFSKYSDSTASEISGAVNDAYLKSQGQVEGTKSYDLVTELATAYILKNLEK